MEQDYPQQGKFSRNSQDTFNKPRFNQQLQTFSQEPQQQQQHTGKFSSQRTFNQDDQQDRRNNFGRPQQQQFQTQTNAEPSQFAGARGSDNQFQKNFQQNSQSLGRGRQGQSQDFNARSFSRGAPRQFSQNEGGLRRQFDSSAKKSFGARNNSSRPSNNDETTGGSSYQGRGGSQQFRSNSNGYQSGGFGNHNPNRQHQPMQSSLPYCSQVHSKGLNEKEDSSIDDVVTVLMVAEKPSIARSIAEALGGTGFTTRKGICKFTNVFTFQGALFGKKALIKVTSVIGHIYTSDFTQEFQDWRRVDPYKLFSATTQKKETNPDSQIIPHLQKEAMGASYLVLWLDNDREGENICFEVLTICQPELIREDYQQIFRAKFSSITPIDIRQSFDDLAIGPNLNESIAVDARQIIDLKVGVAFSRFQTRYLVRKYEDLNNKKITFGPCQTPTLAFCVQRDDEIKAFITESFYRVIPKISLVPNQLISLEWTKDRTYDEAEAIAVKSELEQIGSTTVIKVDNKEMSKYKPIALNTVNFLKMASKQYGLGPQNAMQVAEKLYLGGYITYPRTESTKYADRFDFNVVLQAVSQYSNQSIATMAKSLLDTGVQRQRAGKDVGDHPPITPTSKPIRQSLSRDELNVYELVSRNFLASIASDCRLFKKKVVFQTASHTFTLVGTALIDKGFMEAFPWQKINENEIPNFEQGDEIYLHSVESHTGTTQPPDQLSEADLLGLMESNGIGTDASMAQHVANICDREYVTVVGQSRRLIPTDLGSALVHAYADIDAELVAPNLRSSIERSVELIAKGELEKDHVLNSVLELFKNKYLYFVSKVQQLDHYFDPLYQSIESSIATSQYFTKCGRCKTNMKLLDKVGKVFCERCKFMYGLPRDSKFSIPGECFCPLDGFQLILVSQTVPNTQIIKTFTLCPLCFQKPPEIEDYKPNERYARTSCNLCTNKTCQFSMPNNEIGQCTSCKEAKGGRLVLDWPTSEEQTMSCNGCNIQYALVKNGSLIRSTVKCTSCTCYQVKIETKEGYKFMGCVFCDKSFRDRMEVRRPLELISEDSERSGNTRYFDSSKPAPISNSLQSSDQKPFNVRQSNTFSTGRMEVESSATQGIQVPEKRRGRPPKDAANSRQIQQQLFPEKENSLETGNKSVQGKRSYVKKPRSVQTKSVAQDDIEDIQPKVDIVKKSIQKTRKTSSSQQAQQAPVQFQNFNGTSNSNNFQAQPQQFGQQTFQQQNAHKNNRVGSSILEDSYQQDIEFFSKFPKQQQQQMQQQADTEFTSASQAFELLNDSSALLADIERAHKGFEQDNNNTNKNNTQKSTYNYSSRPLRVNEGTSSAFGKQQQFRSNSNSHNSSFDQMNTSNGQQKGQNFLKNQGNRPQFKQNNNNNTRQSVMSKGYYNNPNNSKNQGINMPSGDLEF